MFHTFTTDPAIFDLVKASASLETTSDAFVENGREVMKMLTDDMQVINLMNIPTTIPTNNTPENFAAYMQRELAKQAALAKLSGHAPLKR